MKKVLARGELDNFPKDQGGKIPDWAVMRKFIQYLQLFKCNLINLVHHIDARHIYPTAFNDIY